jgi:hypothetical protein
LISLEKMSGGKLWAINFLLALLSHGVLGAPVCLLQDLRHARLVRVADQWAKSPLLVRVVPVAGGS